MNQDQIIPLIHQFLTDQISDQDRDDLLMWKSSSVDNEDLYDSIALAWEQSTQYQLPAWDAKKGWEDFSNRLGSEEKDISYKHTKATSPKLRKMSNWRKWAVAASFILAFGTGGFFLHQQTVDNNLLADATSLEQELTLSDGTKVHLREGSTLSYPAFFDGDFRTVHLKGEAYFDVAPDAVHPFMVKTGRTKATVLGTEFDVDATMEHLGETRIYVTEGKVQFNSLNNDKVYLELNAGEQAYLIGSALKNESRTTFNDIAWHTKKLAYRKESIENILKDFEAYYDVRFDISKSEINKCLTTISLGVNDKPLTDILDGWETQFRMVYKQLENGDISIVGGACVMGE